LVSHDDRGPGGAISGSDAVALAATRSWCLPDLQLGRERLSRDLVRIEMPAGRAVILEGEVGDRFYVIESGVVSILKRASSAVEPGEVNRLG
jgi:CRP-like cAMP-binding protein